MGQQPLWLLKRQHVSWLHIIIIGKTRTHISKTWVTKYAPHRVPMAWRLWSLGGKELPAWVQSSSEGVWSSLPCNQAFQTCFFRDSLFQAFLGGSCRWIFWVTVRWNFKVDFLGPPENVPKTFSFHHRTVHQRMLCHVYVPFQIAGKDDNINAPVLLGDRAKLRSIKIFDVHGELWLDVERGAEGAWPVPLESLRWDHKADAVTFFGLQANPQERRATHVHSIVNLLAVSCCTICGKESLNKVPVI